MAQSLGLLTENPRQFLQTGLTLDKAADINQLIAERTKARAERNWKKADEIRKTLLEQGIELEDKGTETNWRFMQVGRST